MAKLRTFIRSTSPKVLQAYFQHRDIEIPSDFDWMTSGPAFVKNLLALIDKKDTNDRARIVADAERISPMAEEGGQVALRAIVPDKEAYERIDGAHDRALWTFVNYPEDIFRRAEEARYADEKRRGRMWGGYVSMPDLPVKNDAASIEAFTKALRSFYGTENVQVEVFERVRPNFDGKEYQISQITIYREGLPSDDLAFETGEVVLRTRRPVLEAALTYEAESGVIEVVAKDKEYRLDLARMMSRDLMGVDFKDNKVPFKKYDLSILMQPHDFPVDASDRIESVKLRSLRLMPMDDDGERITLECMSKADKTIWAMAASYFPDSNPLLGDFVCTQAKLAIKFYPRPGASRGRTMELVVTMPHGCNLKDRTEDEQVIGQKYLQRWKLLEEA
jgi:hypothetical protein